MVKTRTSAKDGKHPSTPPPSSSKKLRPYSSSSTGKKQKNRVLAAVKSPPLAPLPPSVLQSLDQASMSSSHSTTSSRSSEGPPPLNIQKQLAQDIEKGGANSATIERMSTRQTRISCRKIQQQVYRWHTLHQQGQYIDQVLNRFQVKSFPNLRFEE
jgi:hypothetical protein